MEARPQPRPEYEDASARVQIGRVRRVQLAQSAPGWDTVRAIARALDVSMAGLGTAVDPREELAFQVQLQDYARTLHGEGGSISKTWKPEAPPDEWAA
jgi:hypothetical protein